jgi:uridine kinase
MKRLAADMNALMRGEEVYMRKFDFEKHEGFDSSVSTKLPENGVIILEGIHALNPRLTSDIDDRCKFKIYIEPLTQLVVFAESKLPPADARLMRRLVRDNQFRKMSPLDTFRIWPKVLAGEKKWIFPFSSNADAVFDSGLEYELSVLKRYVAGLLEKVKIKMPTEAKAEVLSLLLTAIHDADPTKVPGDSILRETIGGSLLEY